MMNKHFPYRPALFQHSAGEMAFLPRGALMLSSGVFSKMGGFVGVMLNYSPLPLARDHQASPPPLPVLKIKTTVVQWQLPGAILGVRGKLAFQAVTSGHASGAPIALKPNP
ncbi:hypothetical protein ACFL45_02510 [Candidatus Neomarinimicrobiota bacterium]